MKTKPLIVGNWKLNPPTLKEARGLFAKEKRALRALRGVSVVICPPVPYLATLAAGERTIIFGAQDVSIESRGAFTGEVSAESLKSAGARYAIIGHSERRARGESDALIAKKVRAALEEGLTPILCVGEHLRDEHGSHLEALASQMRASLASLSRGELSRVVVAYEPVWAIGKRAGDALDAHGLHETVIFIRKILSDMFDRESALKAKILYGGSVEPENAFGLIAESGVSGFLVGHASLDSGSFAEIARAASHA